MQQQDDLRGAAMLADVFADRFSRPFLMRNMRQIFEPRRESKYRAPRQRIVKAAFEEAHRFDRTIEDDGAIQLRIVPLSIGRSASSLATGLQALTVQPQNAQRPLKARCRIRMEVFAKEQDTCYFSDSRDFFLQSSRGFRGDTDLSLVSSMNEHQFEVDVDRLYDVVYNGHDHSVGMLSDYELRMTLTVIGHQSLLRKIIDPMQTIPIASPLELTATLADITLLETTSRELSLFTRQGSQSPFCLRLDIGWGQTIWSHEIDKLGCSRPETSLELVCTALRSTHENLSPARSSSPIRTGSRATRYKLKFSHEICVVDKSNLSCLWCSDVHYRTPWALIQHLEYCHFRFNYDLLEPPDKSPQMIHVTAIQEVDLQAKNVATFAKGGTAGTILVDTILSKAGDRGGFINSDEVDWTRPRIANALPFEGTRQITKSWQLRRPPLKAQKSSVAANADSPVPTTNLFQETLAEVQPRLVPIPKHPGHEFGQRFIWTGNKMLLATGELMADEHEILDSPQLAILRRATVNKLGLSEKHKKFLIDIGEHLASENIQANIYLANAIKRWMHKRAQWLQDDEIGSCFEDYASAAWKKRYISQEDYATCLSFSQGRRGASFLSTTTVEPIPPQLKSRRRDECICGKPVEGMRGVIMCSNPDCKFPEHHLACVKLKANGEFECKYCRRKRKATKR